MLERSFRRDSDESSLRKEIESTQPKKRKIKKVISPEKCYDGQEVAHRAQILKKTGEEVKLWKAK